MKKQQFYRLPFLCALTLGLTINIASASAETIKIGVIAPLSGMRADAGHYMVNAISLAEADLKMNSQLKYQVKFVIEDSQYAPAMAVSAFHKLQSFDKIRFFIGPYGSAEVLAVGPIAENTESLVIAPGGQSDEISSIGNNTFRLIHNFAQEAPVFANFVADQMRGETLDILTITSGHSYFKSFRPAIEKRGKKIGSYEEFDSTTIDFRSYLMKLKAHNAKDIFLGATPIQAGTLLKQARELGVKAQFYNIGVQSPEIIQIGGVAAEGLFYPYSYDGQSSDPLIHGFYNRYLQKFGVEPDAVAANSYDSVMLLGACFEKTDASIAAVRQCLYDTRNFPGVGGSFSIDKNGDVERPLIVKTVKDGRFIRYR